MGYKLFLFKDSAQENMCIAVGNADAAINWFRNIDSTIYKRVRWVIVFVSYYLINKLRFQKGC